MNLKNIVGKLIFGELRVDENNFARDIEQSMIETLQAQPKPEFDSLLDLQNLRGENTGYVKVFSAPKLDRAASLSIDIMPGMRYFNIHIIPDHHFNIPRFNVEGMITTKGSQISMDLYPDMDLIENYDYIKKYYTGIENTYLKAKQNKQIRIEPSRLPHMRALCSPYFLMANKIPRESLPDMENYAKQYFQQWLNIYHAALPLTENQAEFRLRRRQWIARTIIDNDPDRDKVVDTYGEEKTQLIEQAAML